MRSGFCRNLLQGRLKGPSPFSAVHNQSAQLLQAPAWPAEDFLCSLGKSPGLRIRSDQKKLSYTIFEQGHGEALRLPQ